MATRKKFPTVRDRYVSGPQKLCEAQLDALAGKVLAKCLDRYISVDTVVVLVKGLVSAKQKRSLRQLIGRTPIVRESRYIGYTHIRLHQPNIETINYISDEFRLHIVSRVDVAVDFIVQPRTDARFITETILQSLTMSWRRKAEVQQVGDTTYYGWKRRRRNIVAYYDRPSKITGEAVAHIEFRRLSAKACRSLGLHSLRDILTFDMVALVRRQANLSTFNWPLVEKHFEEEAGSLVQKYSKNYPIKMTRERAAARIKLMNARVICDSDDFCDFEAMKASCPAQVFIDHQKNTGLMPRKFLDARVTRDIYPLLEGAVIVRPMGKGKVVGLELMRQDVERA